MAWNEAAAAEDGGGTPPPRPFRPKIFLSAIGFGALLSVGVIAIGYASSSNSSPVVGASPAGRPEQFAAAAGSKSFVSIGGANRGRVYTFPKEIIKMKIG